MEEQVRERLSRLDRAKDDFVSTVSHELRTPLTSISGYVELFEDDLGEELSAHERGMLTVIKRNVSRLRSLIEDLLTLSSIEDEAYHPAHEAWDLNQLAADAVHDVTPAGVRAQVSLGLQPAEQELRVLGDGDQLSRAVLNLLANAVKFNRPGGSVQVTLSSEGGEGRITVRDTGIGIPAEELAALGTRFFRASNAVDAEVGGTGLGLRIVQSIAARHGGRLTLESHVGEGTTATLVLPLTGGDVAGNKPIGQKITQG
jgi:signal transduction histidine kinase